MPLGTDYPASAPPRPRTAPPQAQPPVKPGDTQRDMQPFFPGAPIPGQTPGPWASNGVFPAQAPLTPQQQLVNDFNAINSGQADSLQSQYLNAAGMASAGYDNESWYRQAQANNDLARLGISEANDVGLGRERNGADRGFAQRGFDIDSRGNMLQRDMRYRANDSEAAGRGSITSSGYGQNNRDILGQFGIAQDTTQLTFDKKMSDLTLDDKALDNLAKDFGVRRSDINNALKYGMTKIGLDYASSVQELNAALNSGNAALAQNALNFMTQVMGLPMDVQSLSDNYNKDGSLKIAPSVVARETQPDQVTPGDRPPVDRTYGPNVLT